MGRHSAPEAFNADLDRVATVAEVNPDLIAGYLVCAWLIDDSTRLVTTACCVGHALAVTARQHDRHRDEYPVCTAGIGPD